MLHSLLSQYLEDIEAAVKELKQVYIEHYSEEILNPQRINLRIRIRFASGHLLEFNEAVIINNEQINHLSYRYHFQDKQNKVVFRYDNAPHFPTLDNFPHHKHLSNKVNSTKKTSIINALKEASLIIENLGTEDVNM
ncbi:MAG: DUF6516 family protein [Candidatus Aminicenantes bacterium]|jgi:hypothetical protein